MRRYIWIIGLLFAFQSIAQTEVSLQNMSDFRSQAGNWFIVGEVTMDRNIDIHDKPEPPPKKKKKKTVEKPVQAVTYTEGTGILLNMNDEVKRDQLITNWEHGDILLQLDVMIPRGSNSGIYLQGRYEIQLYDSWGVRNPGFSDIGGIYRNWESTPGNILKGIPPSGNPSKAPGLWQHFEISFKAPRFDENGNKIKNALFEYVELNGVRIHNNVEVALPTGGPIEKNEVPFGPLMIQGDHGPVAFRNIRYTLFGESKVALSNLTFTSHKGLFKNISEINSQQVSGSGSATKIDVRLAEDDDEYALVFEGDLVIPADDEYTFSIGYSGGVQLIIDDETQLEVGDRFLRGRSEKVVSLTTGTHKLKLTNFKGAPWNAPQLGLYIKSPSTNFKKFHSDVSYPEIVNIPSPILVESAGKPRLLRGFVYFRGSEPKLSHTIGVGDPAKVNYIFDMNSANVVGSWRGNFIDATPMWHNRGNGSFRPNGSVNWTFNGQSVAELPGGMGEFPVVSEPGELQSRGYEIDQNTGMPVFRHSYKGVDIENRIRPDKSGNYLLREISFSQSGMSNWYLKIAEGPVKMMPDGSYAIGDQEYYINILQGSEVIVRDQGEETELLMPIDGGDVKYEIIW